MVKIRTELDEYQEKLVERRQSLKAKPGNLTGRHDLQPVGTTGRLKKKLYSSKERVSISGNIEI